MYAKLEKFVYVHNIIGKFKIILKFIFLSNRCRWGLHHHLRHALIIILNASKWWGLKLSDLKFFFFDRLFSRLYICKLLTIVLIHDHKRVDKVWAWWSTHFGPCGALSLLLIVNYVFSSKIRFILGILLSNFINSLVEDRPREVNHSTCGPIKNSEHLAEFTDAVRFLSYLCVRVPWRGRCWTIGIFTDEWSTWGVAEVTHLWLIRWIRALQ